MKGKRKMNLISCQNCGVVLNKGYLYFPDTHNHNTQELIKENVEWDGEAYVAILPCPACGENIRENDE